MEASGTGNMKLALNGAVTIGTLYGANIEIREHVGPENIAIFGMEAIDVMVRRQQGLDATDTIRKSPQLARAINAIASGEFSPGDPGRFESIAHALRHLDHYMVSADFDSYYGAQRGIDGIPKQRGHRCAVRRALQPHALHHVFAPMEGPAPGLRRQRRARR